jgi:hypothetical protein
MACASPLAESPARYFAAGAQLLLYGRSLPWPQRLDRPSSRGQEQSRFRIGLVAEATAGRGARTDLAKQDLVRIDEGGKKRKRAHGSHSCVYVCTMHTNMTGVNGVIAIDATMRWI